ncbi:MAG: energy transducer TonB [Acidobacteria bacterium]|nr:energy transducer TonB [Acidobacteriota bacterium]
MSAAAPHQPFESVLRQRDRRAQSRRLAAMAAALALHGALIVTGLIGEARAPAPIPPDVELTFIDPAPVRPELVQPVPPPAAEPRRAAPEPPRPVPPAPDERPLIGWNSRGETEGTPTRPPGPEGPIHAPSRAGGGDAGEDKSGNAPQPPEDLPADDERPAPPPAPDLADASGDNAQLPQPSAGGGRPANARPAPPRRVVPGPGRGTGQGPGTGDFGVGMNGSMFGELTFESSDYNWSDYSTKLYFAIYRAWLRELYGRTRRFERDQAMLGLPSLDAEVRVRFVLHRAGPIDGIEVVAPSPVPTLDEATTAALRRAVTPPFPADFPREREAVTGRFTISGFENSQQLENQLYRSQLGGEF